MRAREAVLARAALDGRFESLSPLVTLARPAGGWVRAIREALGMSAADLGARLGVTSASVSDLERSERDRRVRLDTLERAAAAMDCEVVYALVPRGTLREIVERQARSQVEVDIRAVSRSMDLEAQSTAVGEDVVRDEMQALINSGRLWK